MRPTTSEALFVFGASLVPPGTTTLCAPDMDSVATAMTHCAPFRIARAANLTTSPPEQQTVLTILDSVWPVIGNPAERTISRSGPWFAGTTQPTMTSSTELCGMPVWSMNVFNVTAASSSALKLLKWVSIGTTGVLSGLTATTICLCKLTSLKPSRLLFCNTFHVIRF